jgi:hypothetical protein
LLGFTVYKRSYDARKIGHRADLCTRRGTAR